MYSLHSLLSCTLHCRCCAIAACYCCLNTDNFCTFKHITFLFNAFARMVYWCALCACVCVSFPSFTAVYHHTHTRSCTLIHLPSRTELCVCTLKSIQFRSSKNVYGLPLMQSRHLSEWDVEDKRRERNKHDKRTDEEEEKNRPSNAKRNEQLLITFSFNENVMENHLCGDSRLIVM